MLARISSASGGIREYLETGRKKGREFDRELIDDRLVLAGDIDVMDAVIDSIQTSQPGAAKYLHITLGFSERFTSAAMPGPGEISQETMREVAEAYRELLMSAYDPDEYAWYAEAHIPKVSHDLHAGTGGAYERLPHVHIVLPMRNLVDGKYLNPTGFGKHNIEFEQAIQEVINSRFKLKSPLQSRRVDAPMALERHQPKFLARTPKDLKAELQKLIANGDIQSFPQLVEAAGHYGAVRVREGKEGTYVNVKPEWAAKGINLKEFAKETFGGPLGEIGEGEIFARAKNSPDFAQVLADWQGRASHEARYLHAANRKHYKALEPEAKAEWIKGRIQRSQKLLLAEQGATPLKFKEKNYGRNHIDRRQLVAVALYQSAYFKNRGRRQAESLSSVRDLSSVDMVQHTSRTELLLHKDAPEGVEFESGSGAELRRPGAGNRRVRSGVGQVDGKYDGRNGLTFAQCLAKNSGPRGPTADQLKGDTSPALVLEAAAARFGLDRSKYDITSGRDGTPRILFEDKQFNLGDFFTKHLQLDWAATKKLLEPCYYQTLSEGLPPPDKGLWKAFHVWRDAQFKTASSNHLEIRKQSSDAVLRARNKFKAIKAQALTQPPKKRTAILAAARAELIVTVDVIREHAKVAREENKQPARSALYRGFLTELANQGNLGALGELRRLSKPEADMANTVTGRKSREVFPQPSYTVDYRGKVTYHQGGKALVTDSVKGVAVVLATHDSYALAIKVAVARYGTTLTLHGDKTYITNMLAAARASGMKLTVRDGARPTAAPIKVSPDITR